LVHFLLRFLSILPFLTDQISQMDQAEADTVSGYAVERRWLTKNRRNFTNICTQ